MLVVPTADLGLLFLGTNAYLTSIRMHQPHLHVLPQLLGVLRDSSAHNNKPLGEGDKRSNGSEDIKVHYIHVWQCHDEAHYVV
jgi:hypothetical protein